MIGRAIRLATLPARLTYGAVDHGIWLARAAIELYGYGCTISGPDDYEPDWAWLGGLSNEEIDHAAGTLLDPPEDLR